MQEKSNELKEILRILEEIKEKLDTCLLRLQEKPRLREDVVPSSINMLPRHLKRTMLVIAEMGQATAGQVASKTRRARAAESDYLNQLTGRGFLKKERRGKEIYFLVFSLFTTCQRCGTRASMTSRICPACGAIV